MRLKIQAAVTTADRKTDYLPATLESLYEAGIHPQVYRDQFSNGPHRAFRAALSMLVETPADGYLVLQDDIQAARGLADWLRWPESPELIGCVSLYTAGPQGRENPGWHRLKDRNPYGALAILMPEHAAIRFLAENRRPETRNMLDVTLGQFCRDSHLSYWLHSPSLIQHVGEVSTLHEHPINENRRAGRFAEDVKDIAPCLT